MKADASAELYFIKVLLIVQSKLLGRNKLMQENAKQILRNSQEYTETGNYLGITKKNYIKLIT